MIDERFCQQVGTPKQHRYVCYLASKAGYSTLRFAVADALPRSASSLSRKPITVKEASEVIEFLQDLLDKQDQD